MALIRWILGKLILFLDALFAPRSISRSPETQARIDEKSRGLVIYQFEACPFCVKVRRVMKRLNVSIELRDARKNPKFAQELVAGGGELQVPCLRIPQPDGSARWMYESSNIVAYLEKEFGGP